MSSLSTVHDSVPPASLAAADLRWTFDVDPLAIEYVEIALLSPPALVAYATALQDTLGAVRLGYHQTLTLLAMTRKDLARDKRRIDDLNTTLRRLRSQARHRQETRR